MRILIFNWQDIKNPLAGGAEVHLHEVFSRIAHRGHEVVLYCSMFPDAKREEEINGIHVIREGNRYLFNYLVPGRYWSRFHREGYNIIIDDLNKIPFYTPLYVREPLLGITHHLFDKSIFLEVPFPLAAYVYLHERVAVRVYRNLPFIVGSPSTYYELINHGFPKENVHVVNYCVDHQVHYPGDGKKSETPLIGYVGRLKRYKSIEHLLEAFAIVLKQMPTARLQIIGEGDHRRNLEEYVRKLGLVALQRNAGDTSALGGTVEFTGFVSDEKKVAMLQRMHVVVNTSSKEGWGLTVIEANACGTPVIASNVPGLRDSVVDGKTGLLYTYGDVNELAEKILLLLNDDDLRQRLTQEAVAYARTFDWDVAADQTLEIIENTIAQHSSRS